MQQEIRIALRDWDWLTPLVLGEVDTQQLEDLGHSLTVDRVPALASLQDSDVYAGAEVSLSGYVRGVSAGDTSIEALPHVLMQGFRHRCIIVRADSKATSAADLVGGKIGITGWPDSGNTWTRAAVADDGLQIEDAQWFAGRLTGDHPEFDRLGSYEAPGRIEAIYGKPMADRLADGELDAIFTPFMPPGFYTGDTPFRPLYPNLRAIEKSWIDSRGYVPGHHLLAFKPEIPIEVRLVISRLLEESKRLWLVKRYKLAETTAWTAVDFWDEGQVLPKNWDQPGLTHQRRMLEGFIDESVRQGLLSTPTSIDQLFPVDIPAA